MDTKNHLLILQQHTLTHRHSVPRGNYHLHTQCTVFGLLTDLCPRTRVSQIRRAPKGLSPTPCSLQNHLKLDHMPKSAIQALPELWQVSYGSSSQLVLLPVLFRGTSSGMTCSAFLVTGVLSKNNQTPEHLPPYWFRAQLLALIASDSFWWDHELFEFLGKTLIRIRDLGRGEGAAVLCWIWFCLLITD